MGTSSFRNTFSIRGMRRFTSFWYALILTIFFVFIVIPTIYVLIYVVIEIDEIVKFFDLHPSSPEIIVNALIMSFSVSLSVTIIDLIFGLVLAWILANKNFRGKELVNTLIESPLAIPTAGLGFSVALFWARTHDIPVPFGALQIIDNVFILIVVFHFTTTFPYVVRSLTEILEEIDKSYEIAALTSGASSFTAARTITLPMFRSGFATAAILAMAKSLSDTGGVVTLLTTFKGSKLVDTDQIQGTVLIDIWKGLSNSSTISTVEQAQYQAALALVSFLMIFMALIIIFLIKYFIKNVKSPTKKVFPKAEARLSKGIFVHFRNSISISFMILFIFIPSFFILSFLLDIQIPAGIDWTPFLTSIFLSFLVAFIAIILNVIIGVPIGIYVSRKNNKFSSLIDSIIDIPYLVPSAAVGISVFLFWKSNLSPLTFTCGLGLCIPIPDLILVIFAHMAMTFPFIARNVVGGLEEFPVSIEETARSLGATPLQVFQKITLPSIKGSVLAGAVMGFTRSVGETGATLAVSTLETAPVFIVNQIKVDQNYSIAAMATLLLMIIGYIFIWSAKVLINSEQLRKDLVNVKNWIMKH